jgi:uncharacterized protein Yka (UPF0111/DUF47 family)
MTKPSTVTPSERLQQELIDDQEAVRNQTSKLLEQHASSLKKLSSASLDTTVTAIQRSERSMDKLHGKTLQRLRLR